MCFASEEGVIGAAREENDWRNYVAEKPGGECDEEIIGEIIVANRKAVIQQNASQFAEGKT